MGTVTDRRAVSQAAIDSWIQKKRDYGKLIDVGCTLGAEQLVALRSLGPWPPVTEHIRRAVDLYLDDMQRDKPPL